MSNIDIRQAILDLANAITDDASMKVDFANDMLKIGLNDEAKEVLDEVTYANKAIRLLIKAYDELTKS